MQRLNPPSFLHIMTLFTTGIRVVTKRYGEVTCRATLLFASADLPAKAALLNCNQYNGQYGCHTCKHKGEQVNAHRCTAFNKLACIDLCTCH